MEKEKLELLKKPLPAEAITQHPTKTYLSSIKAIYVTERFNEVFWVGKWTVKTDFITDAWNGMIVVKVTFEVPDLWIYYESFGGNDNWWENNKNFDLWDAYKWATTDALTKIGSYLWVGIDVFKWKSKSGNTQWWEKPKSKTDILLENIQQAKDLDTLLWYKDDIETICVSDKQKEFFRKEANKKYNTLK